MKRTTQQRARNIMTTMSTWRSFTSKTTHFILIGCFWNVKNEGDKQDKGGMAQQNTCLQPAKDLDSYCIDKYNTGSWCWREGFSFRDWCQNKVKAV